MVAEAQYTMNAANREEERLHCRNAACDESLVILSANRGSASVFERSEFASRTP